MINQGPDKSGNCRMEKSGEYSPESVPFSKREGIERCYRSGRVFVEYQWAKGKREKGVVHLTDVTKVELSYDNVLYLKRMKKGTVLMERRFLLPAKPVRKKLQYPASFTKDTDIIPKLALWAVTALWRQCPRG